VFVTVSHFHPSLTFADKSGYEPTLRVECTLPSNI